MDEPTCLIASDCDIDLEFCDDRACVPRHAEGDGCERDGQCQDGLFCVVSVCLPPRPDGADCTDDGQSFDGGQCQGGACVEGRCETECRGSQCDEPDSRCCPAGEYCQSRVGIEDYCRPISDEGAPAIPGTPSWRVGTGCTVTDPVADLSFQTGRIATSSATGRNAGTDWSATSTRYHRPACPPDRRGTAYTWLRGCGLPRSMPVLGLRPGPMRKFLLDPTGVLRERWAWPSFKTTTARSLATTEPDEARPRRSFAMRRLSSRVRTRTTGSGTEFTSGSTLHSRRRNGQNSATRMSRRSRCLAR